MSAPERPRTAVFFICALPKDKQSARAYVYALSVRHRQKWLHRSSQKIKQTALGDFASHPELVIFFIFFQPQNNS